MSLMQATVSRILNYSCVDGPGNRLVVFLQGCNFNCRTCHNPHTIGRCDHCGTCVPACHAGALQLVDGRIRFDAAACDSCDACLAVCPRSANPMARRYTVDEVLALVRRNLPFLNGITVSGGEATLQLEFLVELFAAVHADPELRHLTCFVDSNGHLDEAGWQRLLPSVDGVMLDVKAMDAATHRVLTGEDNARCLQSAAIVNDAGKLYELRYLLVPGRNDDPASLDALAAFAAGLGTGVRLRLNAFQQHGVRGAAKRWPAMRRESVEAAATRLRAAGMRQVVTPTVYV